jgi:FkbM family methyltransferase
VHPLLHRIATSPPVLPLYRAARPLALRRKIARFEDRVVEHVYAGVPLRVALADPVGAGWYDHDWPAQPEIDMLAEGRLRHGATVFDIGAHQAVVALIAAARVGDGTVIALEAEPHNVRIARRNADLNAHLPVSVVHAGIAAEPGEMHFSEGLNGAVLPGTRAGTITVPATTVDQMAAVHGHPDVVMIDVEGYEGRALEGAQQVLAARRTDFFVEVHDAASIEPHGWTGARVLERLADAGADIHVAQADGSDPVRFARVGDAEIDTRRRFYAVARFDPGDGARSDS